MGIELQPDLDGPQGAIAFLKHWSPDAPLIFASHTDGVTGAKGAFEAKQFLTPVNWTDVRNWIAHRQKDGNWCNMYFSVNTALGEVSKKLGRADIRDLVALHVDKDIEPGEDQTEGIERIVGIFQKYKHPPTDIVMSGGGAQAFWRLQESVPVNGDVTIAEDLKLYNKAIEADLSGDHCHSLDHIMRLPGTVNIPNEIKLKKGRKPRVAVWYSTSSKTYPLSTFVKAEPESVTASRHAGFKTPEAFTPVPTNGEIAAKLDAKWLRIGVEGDTEGKFAGDRSRMALAFVTACKRAKVDDETIANILMDTNWKVGECIRDKGGETKRHLRRILERGAKFVDEDIEKPAILGEDTWYKSVNQMMIRLWPDGIIFWRGDFYAYNGRVWVRIEEKTIRSAVAKFLVDSKKAILIPPPKIPKGVKPAEDAPPPAKPEYVLAPFNPSNNDVNEMMAMLCNLTHVDGDAFEMPCWYPADASQPDARECINCQNGILHVPTRTLMAHSQEFLSTNIVDYSYDPNATCPLWLSTLAEYWPEAGALEPALLQEIYGYALTPDTSLQKLFFAVGPGRSGKGTIIKVSEALVGTHNVVSTSLGGLIDGFNQNKMLNKTWLTMGECSFARKDDKVAITDFLKTVSGEDKISIQRKYKDDWEGRLTIRVFGACNQIPDFDGAGGAFAMRLVPLKMTRTFKDKPDKLLFKKLRGEVAGILNWAIEGYQRLHKNEGEFTMPEASKQTQEVFDRLSSPLRSFLEDYCVLGPAAFTTESNLFAAYAEWSESVGMHPKNQQKFIEELVSLEPQCLRRERPRLDAEGKEYKTRPRGVMGLSLNREPPAKPQQGQGSMFKNPSKDSRDDDVPF